MRSRIGNIAPKIERANKHIRDLEEAIRGFINSDPYATAPKFNSETRQWEYCLAKATDIPGPILAIAGDAAQNLRSALDYLAWELVAAGGATRKLPERDIGFPIFSTSNEYESGKERKSTGMSKAAIKVIDSIEPYGAGRGNTLFDLHELNRLEKHRLLITTITVVSQTGITILREDWQRSIPEITFPAPPRTFPSSSGLTPTFFPKARRPER